MPFVGNSGFDSDSLYNRFTNLDNIEWHIIDYLIKDTSKYAEYMWKILKYDSMDCLSQPALTQEEKLALVYTSNGNAIPYRVFMSPYIDDAWEEQSAHLHLYVSNIRPKDHLSAKINITFECIIHNKISTILGDASKYNPETNPSEIHNDKVTTPYKNRASVLLKCILGALNGVFVSGVGMLQFNTSVDELDTANMSLWNNRKFFGFKCVMTSILSGASDESRRGF